MKQDKAKALKFYLDENHIGLLEFSQITGISIEDLEGIFLHETIIDENIAEILSSCTNIKDKNFWINSKGNY